MFLPWKLMVVGVETPQNVGISVAVSPLAVDQQISCCGQVLEPALYQALGGGEAAARQEATLPGGARTLLPAKSGLNRSETRGKSCV